VSVTDALEIVDLLVQSQQKSGIAEEDPAEGAVVSNHAALKILQKNLQSRGKCNSKEYGVLCHKMSLLYLHESRQNEKALKRARRLAKESVRLLRQHTQGDSDGSSWLRMCELHLSMLSAARQRGAVPAAVRRGPT